MTSITTGLACPVHEGSRNEWITLAHGEGGRLMRRLIQERIMPPVENEFLRPAGDAAVLPPIKGRLAMSTDSFVVSPLFFPGGDIGSLAVYGTVNDLAVAGAVPRWISLAFILEEGLDLGTLEHVLASVSAAAKRVGVAVVTGDTKVVPRGAADKLFINTTGIGEMVDPAPPGPSALQVGDELLVSGPIGCHGMAVLGAREGFALDSPLRSDSAPLNAAVAALMQHNVQLRAMRDATRGGIGAVLHEWSESSGHTLAIDEQRLPVLPEVRGACELLGLDPVHVANEGTMLLALPHEAVKLALAILRAVPETQGAVQIGRVLARGVANVVVSRGVGREVPLDEPLGAPLPRIC